MWITPAGGGVWRTDNALAAAAEWTYLGGPLGINAAGSVTIDPNDPTGNTIYVGTGEANICGSGCVAGVGIYKSTNGGNTWTGPARPRPARRQGHRRDRRRPARQRHLYAATTTALRGMSSSCCAGVTRPVPGAAKWGLYKSTDGGTSWRVHPQRLGRRGRSAPAPSTSSTTPSRARRAACATSSSTPRPRHLYAGSYARGIWRSTDAGATWTQIKPSLNPP